MGTEIQTFWKNDLIRTSENKELTRVGTPQGMAYELIGVDGTLQGGIRPVSGFRKVYELDFYADDLHDETSVVTDFFPVNFRIGADKYGFGFVYRATRSRALGLQSAATSTSVSNTSLTGSHSFSTGADLGSSTSSGNPTGLPGLADVFIDFWDSTGDAALGSSTTSSFGTKGYKLVDGVSPTAQMDVLVFGRLIYIFIQGRDPALFYVNAVAAVTAVSSVSSSVSGSTSPGTSGNAASYTLTKLGHTSAGPFPGPGRQPLLISPQNATALGNLAVPPGSVTYKRPMVGQVVLTTVGPQASGLYGDITGGFTSESGWGSSSFLEGTSYGTNTLSTTSNAGSNFQSTTSVTVSSNITTSSSGASMLDSHSSSASYSDPTSSCSDTSGTGSLSANAPKIIAGIGIIQPLSTLASPPFNFGLLNRPKTQTVSFRLYDQFVAGFASNNYPNATHVVIPTSVEFYFASLDEYLGNPAVLDTPVFTATNAVSNKGFVAADGQVTFYPSNIKNIKSGTVYLWGIRAFNGSTACGFSAGNYDEPVAGGTDIPPNISELAFSTKIGGFFKYRTVEGVDGNSASSDNPGGATGKYAAQKFEPGDYSFGVFLYDSKTGRKSAMSEVAQAREQDFNVGLTSELSDDNASHYVAVELGYDPAKFDQAYIYRSVKLQDAGGTFIASIRHLDAVINLADYHTIKNQTGQPWAPATTSYRHAVYFYRLEDKQLVHQDAYYDPSQFDESMPKGGTALFYGDTMFVSRITESNPKSTADEVRQDDGIRGIGELRYSSLASISPELFPPGNRFVPAVPTNEIVRMKKIGPNAVGFSKDRLYHIRREGYSVKPQEMHEGYGIVGHKAVDAVGSLAYYVTPKGVKAVNSLGELDDFKALDVLIQNAWVNNLENVSVAFDPFVGAVFIHNPDLEHTAVVWFNTGMITELVDMVFSETKQGSWPSTFTNYASTLTDRALFLQNAPKTTAATVVAGFKPRIYVLDHDSSRDISGSSSFNGQARRTLLDMTGDSRFETSLAFGSSSTGTLTLTGGTLGTNFEGCYVYVMDCPTASFIGMKAKVQAKLSATEVRLVNATDLLNLPVGSRVGFSPVYFRWVGPNLGLQDQDGMIYGSGDFHRVKQLDALGCSFVDVSGPPVGDEVSSSSSGFGDSSTDAKYRALVYRGTEANPTSKVFPKDNAGDVVPSVHEIEGERWAAFGEPTSQFQAAHGVMGVALSPGVEVFCPDLDFRLLSVLCAGKILDTFRTRRPS